MFAASRHDNTKPCGTPEQQPVTILTLRAAQLELAVKAHQILRLLQLQADVVAPALAPLDLFVDRGSRCPCVVVEAHAASFRRVMQVTGRPAYLPTFPSDLTQVSHVRTTHQHTFAVTPTTSS